LFKKTGRVDHFLTELCVLSPHVAEFITPADEFHGLNNFLQIIAFDEPGVRPDSLNKGLLDKTAGQEELSHSKFNDSVGFGLGSVPFLKNFPGPFEGT
jgi:hypothetical protein